MAAQEIIPGMEGLARREPEGAVTPMRLVEIAVSQNADIDKLGKLLDLQMKWEANEARKSFVEAMNRFKANPPAIRKNKHVEFGNTKFDHATLDHVTEQVTKGLSAHGISHRWETEQPEGKIRVTCIITHEMGHSERTTLEGPADNSGSKNAIQSIGSAVTYLERYTLLAATGLAAEGDDDGRGTGKPSAAPRQRVENISERCEWIANARNAEELERLFKESYKVASAVSDTDAQKSLIAAKDKRKKELQ